MTAQDVMAAAQAVFDRRRAVTGWLRAPEAAAPAGAAPAGTETQEQQG